MIYVNDMNIILIIVLLMYNRLGILFFNDVCHVVLQTLHNHGLNQIENNMMVVLGSILFVFNYLNHLFIYGLDFSINDSSYLLYLDFIV